MGFFGGGGGGAGLPTRKTTWIENGVVRNLTYDRYWAQKTGREPLPFSGSLVMEGGSGSLDELIAADRASSPGHAVLVHPRRQPARGAVHRTDARRCLAGREGQGRAPRQQLPVQRRTDQSAQQRRSDIRVGRGWLGRIFPDDALACHSRQQVSVHVEERRGLKRVGLIEHGDVAIDR